MKLVQNKVNGTQSWFILVEKTKDEIEKEELTGVIDDLVSVLVSKGVVY